MFPGYPRTCLRVRCGTSRARAARTLTDLCLQELRVLVSKLKESVVQEPLPLAADAVKDDEKRFRVMGLDDEDPFRVAVLGCP